MKLLFVLALLSATLPAQTKSPAITPIKVTVYYDDPDRIAIDADLVMALSGEGISVPANSVGRFEGEIEVSKEGWFIGPASLGHSHNINPKDLVYTVANAGRKDLLCPDKDEVFLVTGSTGTLSSDLGGYGYHLRPGDRLRLSITLRNTTATPIHDGDIGIVMRFQPTTIPPFRRDVYPMWFNSRGCGPADFDLQPGKNISSGTFEIPVTGTLVAIKGALRERADYLEVQNRSRENVFLHQSLDEVWDWTRPKAGQEFRVDQGDFIAVAAGYNNRSSTKQKNGGIGVALGLFLPVDETKMAGFEKKIDSATAKPTAADSKN